MKKALTLLVLIQITITNICNGASISKIDGNTHSRNQPRVEAPIGPILGRWMITREAREYMAFMGVPYATPPLGELRFKSPLQPQAWNGTLDGTQLKPECLQRDLFTPELVTTGSEDCLYVNIYTPKTTGKLPVMFYIHGGGPYESGSRYRADYFLDQDIVLITFNYRLGVLGNLNTLDLDSDARGNQGLKDQVMALRWVQENIDAFGGDNQKVTIFGNSFGSMAVSAHLMSPLSAGLFHQAIGQSGELIMPSIFTQYPLDQAVTLARKLNCPVNSTTDIVQCFRNMNGDTLVLSSHDMMFTYSVERPGLIGDIALPDTPLNLLRAGKINPVTLMLGVTSAEALGFSLPILMSPEQTYMFNNFWDLVAIPALALDKIPGLTDPERISSAARTFYLGHANVSRETEPNFTALLSDRLFVHPTAASAGYHLENLKEKNMTDKKIFLFYFNKESDVSNAQAALIEYGPEKFLGASHADELQYLFPYRHNLPFPYIPTESKDFNFSRMMIRLWSSFAETGVPKGAYNDVEWTPIDSKPFQWFKLDEEPQMIDTLGDRMNFWDTFNATDIYL